MREARREARLHIEMRKLIELLKHQAQSVIRFDAPFQILVHGIARDILCQALIVRVDRESEDRFSGLIGTNDKRGFLNSHSGTVNVRLRRDESKCRG